MGLFHRKKLETLEDLFVAQIEDLYDAEQRLTEALPEMIQAAHAPKLKVTLQNHLVETRTHLSRLEKVFSLIGHEPKADTCDAMKGILEEGSTIIKAKGESAVLDAGLIAAGQRVEHYEIAGYGTARTLALRLGHQQAAHLLQQTLEEEAAADRSLTDIAESYANAEAPLR